MSDGNGSRVRWDGTISLGTMLTAAIVAVSVIGGAAVAVNRIEQIQATVTLQGEKFDRRLSSLEETTTNIRLDMAKSESMRVKVEDHEVRLRRLESNQGGEG